MIVTKLFMTRKDGVDLYKRIDALVDKNGEPVEDKKGNLIPTGFKIRKIGTDEVYDEAIDVDGTPYTYEETDIPIEEVKE